MFSRAIEWEWFPFSAAREPAAILAVIPFSGGWIWVKHPQRGWELPGGKRESNEPPEQALRREVFEEAGALITNPQLIMQYLVPVEKDSFHVKWVYLCELEDIQKRPASSEIVDVRCFRPTPSPDTVKDRPDMSFVVKDGVYTELYRKLAKNLFEKIKV